MSATPETKPTIVLFTPAPYHGSKYYGLPLPLLAISALPHSKGWPVKIVVQDVDDDYEQQVMEACDGALLLGVTSLTGTMIGSGLEMCAKVREKYPNLPIVWGGTHPSIAPVQTVEHPLIDIVVAGQGEGTFMELVEALYDARPLESVQGIYFKRDGEVVETPERPKVDIDKLPPMPLELLDVEKYITLHSTGQLRGKYKGRRSITYYSSYGCPFSCSFCSEPLTSNRRWFAKSPERVIDELEELSRVYKADLIVFEDPIYFTDLRRVRRISELIIERGLEIIWSCSSRLEAIKKIDDETWGILKRSGFTQVFIGVESASPTVLKAIGKRYTADEIVEAARILHERDVQLVTSFIQGLPVEAAGRSFEDILAEDMRLASQTILRMIEVNPTTGVGVLMYTPYPGSVAFDLSVKFGFKPPETLEGWKDFGHYSNQVPWMLPEQLTFAEMSPIANAVLKHKANKRGGRARIGRKAILGAYEKATRYRYANGYWKYPIEQRAMSTLVRRVIKKKKTDDAYGFLI
jgi:anaerobic magnesium-protoporphyrin IX monomethyl ester cyclase